MHHETVLEQVCSNHDVIKADATELISIPSAFIVMGTESYTLLLGNKWGKEDEK